MTRTVLLDTHSFLWFTMDDASLTPTARRAIEDSETSVLVSWATAWEMGIKFHRGLLKLPGEPRTFFVNQMALNYFDEAPILLDTALFSTELPPYHRDPFDRLIIAETLRRSIEVVSSDAQFDAYGVRRVW